MGDTTALVSSLDGLTREVEAFEARTGEDMPELTTRVRAGVANLQRALRLMKAFEAQGGSRSARA